MLAIRLQRTGRKGYPTYRVIVQEAHRQPTSGRIVAQLGSYNPHTKQVNLDKEKAETYLKNGAQPSERIVKLFEAEKIALPAWVEKSNTDKKKSFKNQEKLRKNRPAEPEEAPVEESEAVTNENVAETPEAPTEAEASEEKSSETEKSTEDKK